MITGISDVYLNVQDMNRAVAFYRDVLQMKVIDTDEWWSSLECGGIRIGLHGTGGKPVPAIPHDAHGAHCGATLTLRTDDIRADFARMEKAGARFLSKIEEEPWGKLATFVDPDGNVLKLMER